MKNLRHLVTLGLLASAASLQAAQITWVGETSASWGAASNWDLFRVPNTTEQVIFPSFGLNKTMSNNRTAGTVYTRLTFSGSGYTLNGTNSIALSGAGTPLIETTHTSGITTLNCPITLSEAATFSSSGFSGSPFFTSGTLVVGGTVTLGANLLTLSTTTAIDIDGTISGTGGVTTTGTGLVRFDGNQLFTGLTTVGSTSDLLVNGSMPGSVSVLSTGTFSGSGTIGGTVFVSGDVTPGRGASVGRLTITGNLEFQTGTGEDDAFFNLDSTTVATGYDQIRVGGSVTPNAARINLDPLGGFPVGSSFILIDKTSAGAMTTGFRTAGGSTLSENTLETIGMNVFRYNYTGGNGNDFTATTVLSTSSGTREWDGGGVNTSWITPTNWVGDASPVATNTVVFGLLAASDKRSVVGTSGNAFALSFTGGGYTIAPGLEFTLSNGITASHASGTNTITTGLTLGAAQTFALSSAGNLTTTNVATGGFALTANNTGSGSLGFNGDISGAGAFIKNGSGLSVFSGSVANTYAGTTTINHGELRVTKSAGIGIPGNLTVGDGTNTASLTTTVAEKIADNAVVTVKPAASFAPAALETIGGLVLDGGAVNSGASILAIGGNITANQSTTITSPVQINGAVRDWTVATGQTLALSGPLTISPANGGTTQRKTGPGTLVVSGNAAVTSFNLEQGTLQLDNPSETLTFNISLNGGTLSGSGRAVRVTAAAGGGGGVISPATGSGSAIFKATRLTANNATTFEFDINGATAGSGHDQLDIAASSIDPSSNGVTLANAALVLRDTVALPLGTIITLIKNDGNDAVSGTFTGLANFAFVTTNFNRFILSYNGGTGNDVTLTAVTPPDSDTTRVWDGGGGNTSWLTAANWAGDVVPAPGDSLEFPSAVHVTSTNDFPAGMIFHSLTFSGIGSNSEARAISGNAIQLTGNITCSVSDSPSRSVEVLLPITLLGDASITNTNQRSLRFKSPLVTTTANLRFRGDGSATQCNIFFSTGGLLSGPAKVRVEANVNVNLASFAHTYAGGSFVDSGNISGRADVVTANGLTLGTGASIATAFLTPIDSPLTGTIIVNSQATLDFGFGGATNQIIQNLQLNNGSIVGESLTFSGDLTIDGSDSLTVATLACQNFTYSAGSCAISSALTCKDYTQSVPTLTVPNVTLSGNLSLAVGASLAATQFTVPDAVGTHTLALAAGSQITTDSFGNPDLANQNFLVTGSGLLQVNTLLATDTLRVAGPELRHNGGIPGSSTFKGQARLDGGKISGNGLFRNIEVLAGGGQITPGTSPGILTSQSAQLNSATTLVCEINGATAGSSHDQFAVGTIVPGDATISLVLDPGYVPLVGQEFILLQHNFDFIPFPGTFAGISEGGTRTLVPGITVAFSYQGGDGNDFSATVTNSPAGPFRVWDGGGGDDNWTTAANWVGDVVPQADEALRFAAGAARTANTNNFPPNTTFRTLLIEGGYTLGGNGLQLSGDLKANISGSSTLNLPVRLLNDSDFATLVELQGPGSLVVAGNLTIVDSTQLTLRRVDPTGTIIGTLDIAGVLRDTNATSIGVFVEGGGKTRFTTGTRNYDLSTEVTHGILDITGGIPGDLKIGGGAFPAAVENPGVEDPSGINFGVGRIPNTATLTLLTNGTHTLVGSSPIEQVGTLVYAGGLHVQPGGGKIRVRDSVEISANTNIQVGQSIFYDFPSGDTEEFIQVAATSSALITAEIRADEYAGSQPLVLGKTGGGSLLVSGRIFGRELRAYEGFVGPVDGGVLYMGVSLRGGTLGGNSTVYDVTGTTSGGTVAPGGITPATRFGILRIFGNLQPVAQTTFSFEIGGITPGTQHDQILMDGGYSADINSAALVVQLANNFSPTPGQTFRIIDKSAGGPTLRNFAGKPEGSSFQTAGFNWTITYAGGDGNDVILTAGTPLAPAAPLAFSGAPVIQPANGVDGARITTAVSGPPGALVRLESSADLGLTSPWLTISQITLDGSGNGNFTNVADPRSVATTPAPKNFFRLVID
jgi:fibronectin-binding autotransporter adhesin